MKIAILLMLLVFPASANAWPTWGNLESGDCAFAAAANWEMIHRGTSATDAQVLAEYNTVSPNNEGISGDELVSYWHEHGIAEHRERIHTADPEQLRRVMRKHGAVIAELAVVSGQRWTRLEGAPDPNLDRGSSTVDVLGGIHFAVVRYTNRHGPIILTWGKLAQMTWWQWQEDAFLLYYV